VRAAPREEDEAARGGIEHVVPAADRQVTVQHVEALILPIVDVQGRPSADAGLEDAQRPASRVP